MENDQKTIGSATNKLPCQKKKSKKVDRFNTCAKFGVLDCSCCKQTLKPNMSNECDNNQTIVHAESVQTDIKPVVKCEEINNQQLYLPSTSSTSNADVQSYVDSVTSSIDFDEEERKIKKFEEIFLKHIKSGEPFPGISNRVATPEDEEIDVVNGSFENLNFSTNSEHETNEQQETSIVIFDTTVENIQIERDINVIVNETISSAIEEPHCVVNTETSIIENIQSDTSNMEEEIDVVNDVLIQNRSEPFHVENVPSVNAEQNVEEEIYVGTEIDEDAPLSTLIGRNRFQPRRKRKKLHRNPVIEDEIIDVVNLTEESSNFASLSTALVISNRNVLKKRKCRHQTINLINANRDDSIIEITDSPVTISKVIPEVIHIDDDELSQNSVESPLKGPSLGTCPVCMEEFTKCEIMSTMCGHVFCAMCIKTVIKTTKKCPKCRKHLTLKSIHPLFF